MKLRSKKKGCVFISAVPITKLFAWGGGGEQWTMEDMGYERLRGRGLCGLVCSYALVNAGEILCEKKEGEELRCLLLRRKNKNISLYL